MAKPIERTNEQAASEQVARKEIVWNIIETDADIPLMSQTLNISPTVATVMANRGIRTKNTAKSYLNPILAPLDINRLKDAEIAFERIHYAIENNQKIMIYGDYDADGVMSTTILYKALKNCGASIDFYIPHREKEGYGLNIQAIEKIQNAYNLLIACDNGISAIPEIEYAQKSGLDVIVIDHHEPAFTEDDEKTDILPCAVAIVNPKQSACLYPFKEMCSAGISLRLMEAFYLYKNEDFSMLREELTVLATIATVCDVVDLIDENRALVKRGLNILNSNKSLNAGLARLITLTGYAEKPIDTVTIGFVLGPCINAAGRLKRAESAVQLLISTDEAEQNLIAQTLIQLNEKRKALTRECTDRALKGLEETTDAIIVLVDNLAHESVAGIVAGRIKERLYRPVILLTESHEDILKGSGRSIDGYNMFEALYANRDLFLRFGGHSMAAGLSISKDNVPELRRRLNDTHNLKESDLSQTIHIDKELDLSDITKRLATELLTLAPFGKSNREPLFISRGVSVSNLRIINDKNTLIFTFGRSKIKGIAFGKNAEFLEKLQGLYDTNTYRRIISGFTDILKMDIVYTLELNTYNGNVSVQVRVSDFKIIKTSRLD
ncbi:MAG: single-stranded-DNA-specific exonuclease RecJ [Turicibacter sp.]|nr:single-stranded-DNA-specific exonuclease RecJ [Turicibacter sp.]